MKVGVKHFTYNNLLQDFKFMKSIVKIAMDVSSNIHHYFSNTKNNCCHAYKEV